MKIKICLVLVALLFTISCNSEKKEKIVKTPPLEFTEMESPPQAFRAGFPVPVPEEYIYKDSSKASRKFTKSGEIKFKLNSSDFTNSKVIVDSLIKKYNGLIMSEQYNKNKQSSYDFETRIPNKNYDEFISKLKLIFGNPEYINLELEDFTKDYYEYEARLKSRRAYLEKCTELLKKATKVSDLLTIEEKISEVLEDIERMTGVIKSYDDKYDNYTLNIGFITNEFKAETKKDGFFANMLKSLVTGFDYVSDTFFSFIANWPLWLALALVYFLVRRYFKKRKNKVAR